MRFVIVLALVACHGPALPALPSQGGPAWIELASEHFTVWTDASRGRATKLVREMEHLRQVVLGVGFAGTHLEDKAFVIALRDGEEVGVFVPEQFVAFAFYGGALKQSGIVLPADAHEDSDVVTHELVHVISFNVIRNQPRWFAEGLANFFESVNIDPDTAKGDVGVPNAGIIGHLRSRPPTPTAKMFACDAYECMDSNFYATAWAMFAFLANTYPKELIGYSRRLDELPPSETARAWGEFFPALTPDKLDHELRKWLAYGKHTVWKFDVQLKQWPITERTLSDADVYAARALLRERFRRVGEGEPPELARALAAVADAPDREPRAAEYRKDDRHRDGQACRGGPSRRLAEPAARRAAANRQGDEARQAWERACALPGAMTEWCRQ